MWARRWLLLGSPCNVQLGENGLVRQAMPEDVCARGEDQMVTANDSGLLRQAKERSIEMSDNASGPAVSSTRLLDAGSIPASDRRYVVTWPHDHKTLKAGDVVVMTETPQVHNLLLRLADMTLHGLTDEHDQYVHLDEASNH